MLFYKTHQNPYFGLTWIYDTVLLYALHLARHKVSKAEKYFKQCFKWRPLNRYAHLQFARFLCYVLKNGAKAWYHFKLAVRGHPLLNKKHLELYQIITNTYDGYIDIEQKNDLISFGNHLYRQYGRYPKCGYSNCNRIIKNKDTKTVNNNNKINIKNTCKGCKVMMYCNRKCQKLDWESSHRDECVVFGTKQLSIREDQIYKQLQCRINALLL